MAFGGATSLFVRTEMRRRWAAYAGLALVVGLGGGATLGAFSAAYRTDRAYPEYIERAKVGPLIVNPSLSTEPIDTEIRKLPGVTSVHSNVLLFATVLALEPGIRGEILEDTEADSWSQILGSVDGRYQEVDRPVVTEGRMLSGPQELFVTDDFRPEFERMLGRRIGVGDVVPMGFWGSGVTEPPVAPPDASPDEAEQLMNDWLGEWVEPIGVEQLRVVGFGVLSDDVLPDELYPRQRLLVSSDVTRRYDCFPDVSVSKGPGVAQYFPLDCSMSYRYYSLDLEPGVTSAAMRSELTDLAARLDPTLPPDFAEQGFGYEVISQDRTDLDRAVNQTTRPIISALVAFGIAAGVATVAVTALACSRVLRRSRAEQEVLRALGVSPLRRAGWAVFVPWVAALIGLAAALVVATLLSPVSPIGSVRALTPSPGFGLAARATLPVVGVLAVLLAVLLAAVAWRSVQPVRAIAPARWTRASSRLVRTSRPAMIQGLRSAYGRGGTSLAVASILAFAAVIAATIFGTTLSNVVRSGERYGWPWSAGAITGAGYSDTIVDQVRQDLDARDDVERYAFYTLEASIAVAGQGVSAVLGYQGAEHISFPVIDGRAAERPGEMVVGTATLDRLEAEIGDHVSVESGYSSLDRATIVGTAVLPSLGPFVADRTGLGRGAFILTGDAPDADDQVNPAFTGIVLRAGVDAAAFGRELPRIARDWDLTGAPPILHTTPVRPPEIVNIDAMRYAPLALAGTVTLAIFVGVALAVSISVRDRRRELAILRALGFSNRQTRATIGWQVAGTTFVGLVLGLPLGIVGGRLVWGAFARQLGLAPTADLSIGWLAITAAGLVLLGVVAALPAARTAVQVRTADLLRDV